jgi:hypothetical protein
MNRAERRALHPEVDGNNAQIDRSVDPHPKQGHPRPWPSRDCPCEMNQPCAVHDPVVDEGDWDA